MGTSEEQPAKKKKIQGNDFNLEFPVGIILLNIDKMHGLHTTLTKMLV